MGPRDGASPYKHLVNTAPPLVPDVTSNADEVCAAPNLVLPIIFESYWMFLCLGVLPRQYIEFLRIVLKLLFSFRFLHLRIYKPECKKGTDMQVLFPVDIFPLQVVYSFVQY